MAIKGIGIDIVEIGRIAEMVRKYGRHFLDKVYTVSEIEYCNRAAQPAVHFAGRWAAKESFYKALPSTIQAQSGWHSIEVTPTADSRRPMVRIVDKNLRSSLDGAGIRTVHLSISHEKTQCIAFVVLE